MFSHDLHGIQNMSMGGLRMYIFTYYRYVNMNVQVWKCMCVSLTGVTSVRCSGMSNTEPPVCPACCFTYEPRCASALLQLYSTFHSNLRDWELKARWTFFNNEGILCLQYSSWLTHAVWAALQFKGRHSLFFIKSSSGHTPPKNINHTNISCLCLREAGG